MRLSLPRVAGIHPAVLVVLVLLLLLNSYLLTLTDWTMMRGGSGADWTIFTEAGQRVREAGALYAVEADYAYRYSPLLAWVFFVIAPIGATLWRILHVVAALAMPTRWMSIAALASWPFWFDVEAGNLITFVLLVAAWALRDRQWAIGLYLALVLLIPRPLMLPVAVWLLWKHAEWRGRFGLMFLAHAAAVALSGWGPAWFMALATSSEEMASALNFGPSRLIGWLWVPIGLAIAAFLTVRGRLGLASIAASPYWLPYYLAFGLLELLPTRRSRAE